MKPPQITEKTWQKQVMPLSEARAYLAKSKPSKYRAQKTVVDGITFDSKAEAKRYSELRIMEKAGKIKNLRLQPKFVMVVNVTKVCKYIADFEYYKPLNGAFPCVVEDVKGMRSGAAWQLFRIKAKLFRALYGYEITVYPPIKSK